MNCAYCRLFSMVFKCGLQFRLQLRLRFSDYFILKPVENERQQVATNGG